MGKVLEEQDINVLEDSIETVLIDADLLVKYKSPEKAFELLRKTIERHPHTVSLREKMRGIAKVHMNMDEASEQCLALAGLYIVHGQFDVAHDRLLEAKSLDPRVSIASGLEALRQARLKNENNLLRSGEKSDHIPTLAGDIAMVSIFDTVQTIENSRITGLLVLKSDKQIASMAFNDGKIVDAQADGMDSMEAFRKIIEIEEGTFEFTISSEKFPEVINVSSNKTFLLNSLASLEAERAEKAGLRDLSKEELVVD